MNKDSDPNSGLLQFANGRKLEFSEYIGKKALYNMIFSNLSNKDRIAFFCFSIYRYLTEDRHANLDTSPHRALFYTFADMYENNAKFLDKFNRYSGQQLRFFGTLKVETDSGSFTTSGGDTRNYAYKTAKTFLAKHFDVPGSNSKTINRTRYSSDRGVNPEIPVEGHSDTPNSDPIPQKKKATKKETALGCGCMVIIAFVALWIIGVLFGGKKKPEHVMPPAPASPTATQSAAESNQNIE